MHGEEMRKIVCAALFYSGTIFVGNKHVQGLVITGPRHYDSTMVTQIRLMGLPRSPAPVQGFVDQFGCFVDRKEAMEIVKASGQPFDVKRNGVPADELFSEGLY